VHLPATEAQFPGEPGGALAFGDPAQDQHQLPRGLVRLGKDGPRQDGIEAVALLTAIGWERSRPPSGTAFGGTTARAAEALRVQVLFQPSETGVLGEQVGDGKVDHTGVLSHPCTPIAHEPKFQVTIDRDEDGVWIVECPASPGCVSQGQTKEEALENIRDAIQQCLQVRSERGLPLTVETRQVEVVV